MGEVDVVVLHRFRVEGEHVKARLLLCVGGLRNEGNECGDKRQEEATLH